MIPTTELALHWSSCIALLDHLPRSPGHFTRCHSAKVPSGVAVTAAGRSLTGKTKTVPEHGFFKNDRV